MDLKGSLVDTSLRIYPSKKLFSFLETQSLSDDAPENIKKLVKGDSYKKNNVNQTKLKPAKINMTDEDIQSLKRFKNIYNEIVSEDITENDENTHPNAEKKTTSKDDVEESKKVDVETNDEDFQTKTDIPCLATHDVEWLYIYLKKKRSNNLNIPYLHELLEGSQVEVPPNQVLKRNPDLEARCVKLRAQQEAREYRKMTKGVDNVRMRFPEDSISYQLKQMNRQLIAIGQFIISIFAGFLFGFRGVEWMVGNLDFGFRLLLGVMCALVIALAEIYFLAKKLNEELSIPETTQLGGPPKFADEDLYPNLAKKGMEKQHQD